jgi:FixJ family two-component response regulator
VPKILISVVDDDDSVRQAISGLIESFGFAVEVCSSAEDFLRSPYMSETSCLLLDVHMPGMNGLQLQGNLAELGHRIPIIFFTAYRNEETRVRALQAGAVDFLYKPFSDEVLLQAIRSALRWKGGNQQPQRHPQTPC